MAIFCDLQGYLHSLHMVLLDITTISYVFIAIATVSSNLKAILKVDEKAGFLYHNFPKHAKSSSNDALDKVPSVGVSKATMSGKKSR